MKRKIKGKWHVYSEKGKHMGGPYDSEAQANERLRQIEAAKHATGAVRKYKRPKKSVTKGG